MTISDIARLTASMAATASHLATPDNPIHMRLVSRPFALTTGGQPVWHARGAAPGSGIQFAVGDDDGTPDDDLFDDDRDDDEGDDDEDEEDEKPAARKRTTRRGGQQQDDAADGETDWTPPTREAFDRVQEALKKANREAARGRRANKVMNSLGIDDLSSWLADRGIDPETGLPYGTDVVDPRDEEGDGRGDDGDYEREDDARRRRDEDRQTVRKIRAAEERGRTAVREELTPLIMEIAARSELREAGFTGTKAQMERMLRTLDVRTLDLDYDSEGFEVVGMDEEIERLKEDFPQFFAEDEEPAPRRRRSAAAPERAATGRARGAREVDGGNRGRQPAKAKGWREQLADQMMNGRR